MSAEPGTRGMPSVEERLDRLYAELADLKRQLILSRSEATRSQAAPTPPPWQDLLEAAEQVSARWEGPSAVEEVRAQRSA